MGHFVLGTIVRNELKGFGGGYNLCLFKRVHIITMKKPSKIEKGNKHKLVYTICFMVYVCLNTCCSHFLTIIAGVDLHFRHESDCVYARPRDWTWIATVLGKAANHYTNGAGCMTCWDIIQLCSGITCGRVLNGELCAQRLQKLIYLHLFTDCFVLGHGGCSASLCLADPTSPHPLPLYFVSIAATQTKK